MNDFEPLTEHLKKQGGKQLSSKAKVIKNPKINTKQRIKIDAPSTNPADHASQIQPIMEDGVIIGVMHHCNCGRIAEIRFQYETSYQDKES